jgi:DNA-directed RNA polymerase specialized sigma24 family protein
MLKKTLVRWQDGSYDPYTEYYREVIVGKSYQDYSENRFGGDAETGERESEIPCLGQPGEKHEPAAHKIFREAKKVLSRQQAKAWQLVMVNGLTDTEAADKMHISRPAVSQYLATAAEKIKVYCEVNKYRIKDVSDDLL